MEKQQIATTTYTEIDLRLAELLFNLIKKENPAWYVQPKWNVWADHIRKLREIDKRTPEQIEFMIRWVQNDNFWKMNILSTEKLRKQFNNLIVKIKGQAQQKGKNILE